MKKIISYICCMALLLCAVSCSGQPKLTKHTDYSFDYFDTATTIVGYETDQATFNENCTKIKAELERYHKLYTIYTRYEGINNLCELNRLFDGEHKPLEVDSSIIELLEFCKNMHTLTDGKVNVAMGSVLSQWHNCRQEGMSDPSAARLPSEDSLIAAAEHTDIQNVVIDKVAGTVHLTDPDLRLDVGAIAKGYAVEEVAQWMGEQGMSGYLLNVGGNVRAVGKRGDQKQWKVGIENPDDDADKPYIEYLEIEDMSLVTSGSYQRFYYVDGKPYHHIIDPDTLMPAQYFRSVSVLCKDSAKADAFSTALFCMPYEDGKRLVDSTDGVEAMWVSDDGTQRYSDGFKDYCIDEE